MSPNRHVRVVVRTKPTANFAANIIELSPDKNLINIHIPKAADGGYINNQQEDWSFKFDKIMNNVSQEAMYEECGLPIIKSLLEGYNGISAYFFAASAASTYSRRHDIGTILAYGQTGAGKTFTMTGTTENYKHRGLIPRAITHLFREISDRSSQLAVSVKVSYLEIYNETTVDLLKGGTASDMPVVEDKDGSVHVKGLSQQLATCEEDALNLLFEGETNRSIGDHALNRTSSRSHCVFTMYVEARSRIESSERVTCSKLNLVDLAGSERLSKTQSSGVTLKEATYINKSLTFLEQVIIALADKKRDHIPYRQSRLTNVLRDSLGGNCNTLMIANVWGERAQIEETVSTLRFATRMMCVSTEPIVNVQYDPMTIIRKYEREIKELKQELAMHDTLSNRSHIQYEPFTEGQRFELQKKLKHWLEGKDDDPSSLEVVSLRQVRESYTVFRTIYKALELEKGDLAALSVRYHTAHLTLPVSGSEHPGTADSLGSLSEKEEQGGVGETEGQGFGAGMAPSTGRYASGKILNVKIDKKPKTPMDKQLDNASAMSKMTSGLTDKDKDRDGKQARERSPERKASVIALPPYVDAVIAASRSNNIEQPETHPHSPIRRNDALRDPPMIVLMTSQTPLPPIPASAGTHDYISLENISKPVKSEEFERFKKGQGAEMVAALAENKAVYRDKKRQLINMTEQLNRNKTAIDTLKNDIENKKNARLEDGMAYDPAVYDPPQTADAQEQETLVKIKALRLEYKELYEQLKRIKNEMDYANRVIDTCRKKLLADFDASWNQLYPEVQHAQDNDDDLDASEQFSKMHLDKMRQEEPGSYAYYSALRNRKRDPTFVKSKKQSRSGAV